MAEPKLLPCPFCGSSALMVSEAHRAVRCWKCEAIGPEVDPLVAQNVFVQNAIIIWNTRAEARETTEV